MANSFGGILYIGIDNKGEIIGIENTEGIMIKCNASQTFSNLLNTDVDTVNDIKSGTKSGTKSSFESLTGIVQSILDILFKNPDATEMYLSNSLKTPLRTIKRVISSLKSQNIIYRKGSNRKGIWIINKQ